MNYGKLPLYLGHFNLDVTESMFYLYMPIKMPRSKKLIVPERLDVFEPLITEACSNARGSMGRFDYLLSHVYITARHGYVGGGVPANRPGYHSDGFLTKDLNYIWCDVHPTIFNTTPFQLTPDDQLSMKEMEEQADPLRQLCFAPNSLLKLDQYVIHKVPEIKEGCMRTFVKISVSKDRYDLVGNTHNHLINYNWPMKPRITERNVPQSNIT